MPALTTIKRLKVMVDSDGRITPYHPSLHPEDDWWSEVLDDPRARARDRDKPGSWRKRVPVLRGQTLRISCHSCPIRIARNGDELAAINSPEVTIDMIVTLLADCPRAAKRCKLFWTACPKKDASGEAG